VFDEQRDQIARVLGTWQQFLDTMPDDLRPYVGKLPGFERSAALQSADLHAGWVRLLNAAPLEGRALPKAPWGDRGKRITRLVWQMTYEGIDLAYRELYGRKPVRATYVFGAQTGSVMLAR